MENLCVCVCVCVCVCRKVRRWHCPALFLSPVFPQIFFVMVWLYPSQHYTNMTLPVTEGKVLAFQSQCKGNHLPDGVLCSLSLELTSVYQRLYKREGWAFLALQIKWGIYQPGDETQHFYSVQREKSKHVPFSIPYCPLREEASF